MTRFLVVPQWQGSPAARAMLLSDGAMMIAGDLPHAHTTILEVPLEAGVSQGSGVHRLSALQRTRTLIEEAIATHAPEHTVVVGGDCGVSVGAISALHGDLNDVAVIWCDAHPDMHTPATSPSGAYSGMALRSVLADPHSPLSGRSGITPDRVLLVGARVIDEAEHIHLNEFNVQRVAIDELEQVEALAEAVRATGAARVFVHVDVDVLDPAEMSGVSSPAPFGTQARVLAQALRRVREDVPLAGATIAGFAPASATDAVSDMGAVLRLIGALA